MFTKSNRKDNEDIQAQISHSPQRASHSPVQQQAPKQRPQGKEKPRWQQLYEVHSHIEKKKLNRKQELEDKQKVEESQFTFKPVINQAPSFGDERLEQRLESWGKARDIRKYF